jgi:hypothetical protein
VLVVLACIGLLPAICLSLPAVCSSQLYGEVVFCLVTGSSVLWLIAGLIQMLVQGLRPGGEITFEDQSMMAGNPDHQPEQQ